MESKKAIELIKTTAEQFCADNELFLVDVYQVLNRIVVEADGMTNITIDQCARLSRYVQNTLEETGIFTELSLDVSSPGMSNPLKLPIQYQKRLDKNMRIVTKDGQDITAKMVEVTETGIKLVETIPADKKKKTQETTVNHQYDFSQIAKALIPFTITNKKNIKSK